MFDGYNVPECSALGVLIADPIYLLTYCDKLDLTTYSELNLHIHR
jgi:hypothetical protein